MRTLVLIAAMGAVSALRAQVFVVDAANGPGANFTNIFAAVTAVPDGATLLVRAGSYSGFTIDGKGLTILADPNVTVAGGMTVSNTGGNQPVTLRGLGGTPCDLTLQNCAGALRISDGTLGSSFDYIFGPSGGTLTATNCAQLVLERMSIGICSNSVSFNGSSMVSTLTSCTATLNGCTLRGRNAAQYGGLPISSPAAEALRLNGGTLVSSGCALSGGWFGYPSAPPAVSMNGASLRIVDGTFLGGQIGPGYGVAILGTGTLRIDPAATIATGIDPGLTPVIQPMPSLTATDAAPGGTLTASLADPVGDAAILLVGLAGAPLLVPGITDAIWLDPTAYYFAAIGTTPINSGLAVPVTPVFRGFRIGWQGVTFSAANGLQASNAAVSLVR